MAADTRLPKPTLRLFHIPKSAGTSLHLELKQLGLGHHPVRETCVPPHRLPESTRHPLHFLMLRAPRAHVLSLFTHCKYYQWLREANEPNPSRPRIDKVSRKPYAWPPFIDTASLTRRHRPNANGLEAWLRHYIGGGNEAVERFGCYDPRDMTTRALTCTDSRNWATHALQPHANTRSTSAAVNELASLQLVGITEFYHESMCLLRLRLEGRLPASCDGCDASSSSSSERHVRMTHGLPRLALAKLPSETLDLIDAITRSDQTVYAAGVSRLRRDLLDAEAATGRRIICDETLRSAASLPLPLPPPPPSSSSSLLGGGWNCSYAGPGLCYRLTPRSGPCAPTDLGGDCSIGSQGSWSSEDLTDCIQRCAACSRCKHLSFSARHSDCSWFHSCPSTRSAYVIGRYSTFDMSGFNPLQVQATQKKQQGVCKAHLNKLLTTKTTTPWAVAAGGSSAAQAPKPLRLALAFVYFPSAHGACKHPHGRRFGYRCAVAGWCASAARLRAALPSEWLIDRVALVEQMSQQQSQQRTAASSNSSSSSGRYWCPIPDDHLDANDCPGGLTIVRPSAALVDAIRRHADGRLGNSRPRNNGGVLHDTKRLMRTLLRWHFFGAVEYDAVLLADLDVDLLPVSALRSKRLGYQTNSDVNLEWRRKLPPLIASAKNAPSNDKHAAEPPIRAIFTSDSASPLNAGLILLLPSRALFDDGLHVLASPFTIERGWNLTGSPAEVIHQPLLFTDGKTVKHVHIERHTAWKFVGGDIDQGYLTYMLLGRHKIGRYASLSHKPPSHLYHHNFRKPWTELRSLQGRAADAETAPWPRGWSGAPLRAACDAHRYLRPIDLEADGGSASPCLKMMAREREALSNVLRQQATPWPLCVEDCKVLPDNPGGVLWSVVSVF